MLGLLDFWRFIHLRICCLNFFSLSSAARAGEVILDCEFCLYITSAKTVRNYESQNYWY